MNSKYGWKTAKCIKITSGVACFGAELQDFEGKKYGVGGLKNPLIVGAQYRFFYSYGLVSDIAEC